MKKMKGGAMIAYNEESGNDSSDNKGKECMDVYSAWMCTCVQRSPCGLALAVALFRSVLLSVAIHHHSPPILPRMPSIHHTYTQPHTPLAPPRHSQLTRRAPHTHCTYHTLT